MGANSSDLRGLAADQVIALIAEYFQSRNMTLSQAFAFLDRDNSQTVSWDEFVRGINICLDGAGSHRVSNAELWPIFKRFDKNNDDRVSLDEFSAQFYRRGATARNWYEDDMRMRGAGRTIGYGPPVMSASVMDGRRVDDVICRIASAIARTGFSPLQLFQKVDVDRSGRLEWSELERMICSFQPDLSTTERQAIFRRFDADGTGDIDINEFCNTLNGFNGTALVNTEAKVKALGDKFRATGQTVAAAFHVFDRNYDGFLTRDEWFRAIRTFDGIGPTNLTDDEIDVIFRRFDVNGDGYMSIQEFDTFFRDALDRRGTTEVAPVSNYGTHGTYGAPGTASYGISPTCTTLLPGPPVMPVYNAAPVEAPWETEVLDTVRSCLSTGRSGMSITDVFRRLDIDNSNGMSPLEFQRVVTAYRPELQTGHVDTLFRKVNASGTGQITLGEFIRRFG